jgi:hypothetical protein
MTDGPGEAPAGGTGEVTDEQRRARRARVFGDVLPEATGDERGAGWSEPDEGTAGTDEWLRRQVPPHHG